MPSASEAAQSAIALYCDDVANAARDHGALILQLTKEVEAAGGLDVLSEAAFEVTDGVKGSIAAKAANACENSADQEVAIGICESWATENVANGGVEANVIAFIIEHGHEVGARLIREAIADYSATPSVG